MIAIGEKHGMLAVLDRELRTVGIKKKQRAMFLFCECECGTRKWIQQAYVKNGTTVSCGCKAKADHQRYCEKWKDRKRKI